MSTLIDYIRTHWHEVPDGVTVPEGVEFVAVWNDEGVFTLAAHAHDSYRVSGLSYTRFTPEPLPVEPDFELPTEPGYYTDRSGELWELDGGRLYALGVKHSFRASEMSALGPFTPVTLVPNGVGVMDETDKRDRVDATGDRWTWIARTAVWVCDDLACGTIAVLDAELGPLRFADEETDQ